MNHPLHMQSFLQEVDEVVSLRRAKNIHQHVLVPIPGPLRSYFIHLNNYQIGILSRNLFQKYNIEVNVSLVSEICELVERYNSENYLVRIVGDFLLISWCHKFIAEYLEKEICINLKQISVSYIYGENEKIKKFFRLKSDRWIKCYEVCEQKILLENNSGDYTEFNIKIPRFLIQLTAKINYNFFTTSDPRLLIEKNC